MSSPDDTWLAVISDLHVSEGALDDFDPELEQHLISFVAWLGGRPGSAELVINGDFLDFVQAGPWSGQDLEDTSIAGLPLCFREDQSVKKFTSIREAHPRMFRALRAFLACRQSNRLVILPGNHDADFFWRKVRRKFAAEVCRSRSSSQVHFCLARAYRPYEWLWIEHGHQYDPVNAFFVNEREYWSAKRPPIFASADGTKRLYECTGTRFMIRFLNGLDARYPYVDNVKPFSRFIRIFGASALIPGWGPLDAAVTISKMLAYLSKTAAKHPQDLLNAQTSDGSALTHPFIVWVEGASEAEQKKLADTMRKRGLALSMPLDVALERPEDAARVIEFLAEYPDIVAGLGERDPALLGAASGTLTLNAGFNANETEDLYKGAEHVARSGRVRTVVMGHTHEAIERTQAFTYFNTGSWTRYYRFAPEESTHSWRILREQSYERFPYRLRYALVPPGSASATVETWRERFKT